MFYNLTLSHTNKLVIPSLLATTNSKKKRLYTFIASSYSNTSAVTKELAPMAKYKTSTIMHSTLKDSKTTFHTNKLLNKSSSTITFSYQISLTTYSSNMPSTSTISTSNRYSGISHTLVVILLLSFQDNKPTRDKRRK